MSKEEFIIQTLKPYFLNPSICGVDVKGDCQYITPCGKKCAVGRYMVGGPWVETELNIEQLVDGSQGPEFTLEQMLTEEANSVGLSPIEWGLIQQIHDTLARIKNDYSDYQYTFCKNRLSNLETEMNINLGELHGMLDDMLVVGDD